MKRKTLFITALVLLALVFVGGTQWYRTQQAQQAAALAAKNRQALQRAGAPTLGRPDAPVHIVEFFDPACDTCAEFAPLVKQMLVAHPNEIRLTARYAPFHPGSDEVVKALEAARQQGLFWQAQEALLASQDAWVQNHHARADLIWPVLQRAGVDIARVRADMESPQIAAVIDQDMAAVRTLGITATPEFFVNGRPLPSFGYEQLKTLVDEELAAARRGA